jgi:hypothetical protein
MQKLIEGMCDPFILLVIVACLSIGGLYAAYSKKIDAPAEQIAEAILKTQGIDIDFSEGKKNTDADR